MKRPEKVPSLSEMVDGLAPEESSKLFQSQYMLPTVRGKYLHWSRLRYRTPRKGWITGCDGGAIRLARYHSRKEAPLKDAEGVDFSFCMPDPVLEMLHKIDGKVSGRLAISDQVTNPDTRNRYIVSSLIEEAIRSSQLEGASTSRKVASDMLRSGRRPENLDERMILNNHTGFVFRDHASRANSSSMA